MSAFTSGSKFLCSVLLAPVKNENGDVILFIINYEDVTDAPLRSDVRNKNFKSESTERVDLGNDHMYVASTYL